MALSFTRLPWSESEGAQDEASRPENCCLRQNDGFLAERKVLHCEGELPRGGGTNYHKEEENVVRRSFGIEMRLRVQSPRVNTPVPNPFVVVPPHANEPYAEGITTTSGATARSQRVPPSCSPPGRPAS